jgi:hypothetical protein
MSDRNPFTPPKAKVLDISSDAARRNIADLPVSEAWKTKFRLIEKAGGPKQKNLRDLSFRERQLISFNILGFLFGPIYYAVKGMWKKGLAMFTIVFMAIVILSLILEAIGFGRFANALGYGGAALFAVRANIDQYKKWVLDDNGWW